MEIGDVENRRGGTDERRVRWIDRGIGKRKRRENEGERGERNKEIETGDRRREGDGEIEMKRRQKRTGDGGEKDRDQLTER